MPHPYSNDNLDGWPNCSVADCPNKCYHAGGSDKCYPHTFYMTAEEMAAPPPVDRAAWLRRHEVLVRRKAEREARRTQKAKF